jgi:multidrug efflux pump subunit AcrB
MALVRQVQVDLDQRALHSYGLSARDVGDALAAQNRITPVGTEKIGKFEYTINLNDSPKRIEEFNDLPVKVVNGTVVYMRDVAYVIFSLVPFLGQNFSPELDACASKCAACAGHGLDFRSARNTGGQG